MPGLLVFALTLAALQTVAQSSTADPVARAQSALAAILANEFARVEEQFTPEMKAALPPGRLAATWTKLQQQIGAHKSCGANPRVVAIGDKQMVITPCEFEWAKIDVQLAFDRAGRISGMTFRPAASAIPYALPPYGNPSAYAETDVTVGSGEWALPATLSMPAGRESVPAVVLVHGSGPNDRDETIGANKPFKDLAIGLASRGIAVLRYDKRSRVHPGRLAAATGFTVQHEVIDDVLVAVKMLRGQARVDASRVFVLGHSLGAMLVPRIAMAEPSIAGLIVMAGPARPLEEAIVAQTRHQAAADGAISADEQQAVDRAIGIAESVRALKPEDAKSGRMIFGAPASYWLDLRGYDPPAMARGVKAPMLILQGERDYQVTVDEFSKWRATLGSRNDVTFLSYPALNHLFIAGTGPSLPAEYLVPGHVAEDVIRDISSWILKTR